MRNIAYTIIILLTTCHFSFAAAVWPVCCDCDDAYGVCVKGKSTSYCSYNPDSKRKDTCYEIDSISKYYVKCVQGEFWTYDEKNKKYRLGQCDGVVAGTSCFRRDCAGTEGSDVKCDSASGKCMQGPGDALY